MTPIPRGRPAVLRLVQPPPRPVCAETVKCLEDMLEAARAGEIVGVAYVASLFNSKFFAEMTGDLRNDPVLARGMVASLDDKARRAAERMSALWT